MRTTSPPNWRVALELAGGLTAFVAFVAFLGGALLWVRFDELDLPADRAVALLPREMLLVVGAHALAGPVVVALVAVVALFALDPFPAPDPRTKRSLVVTTLVLFVLLVVLVGRAVDFDAVLLLIVAAMATVAVAAIFATGRRSGRFRPTGWVVFASVVLVGAGLAVLRTKFEPKMEPVALQLKDPAGTLAGFYVGEADDRVYVARLPRVAAGAARASAERVENLVAIPKDRVERMVLRQPAGLDEDDAGPGDVQAALEDLLAQRRADAVATARPVAPVVTDDPVPTFAPLVHLHARERIAPTPAEYFLAHSRLVWNHRGRCENHPIAARGAVDAQRLGGGGYAHTPNESRCAETRDRLTSADFTRPFGGTGRAPELRHAAEGFVLDLDDDRRRPRLDVAHDAAQTVLRTVPVYYERHPVGSDVRITYWFFYPLSQPPGPRPITRLLVHEGDWERISVLVRQEAARRWTPLSVRYHLHDQHLDIPWRDVGKAPAEDGRLTHPEAFVAIGSHATYHRPGRFRNVFAPRGRTIVTVHDVTRRCPACPVWHTWQHLVDAGGQPWYGFGGAWGQAGPVGATTGPLGPSRYKVRGLAPDPADLVQRPAGRATTAG